MRKALPRLLVIVAVTAGAIVPLTLLGMWSVARAWYWPSLLPGEWSGRAWSYLAAPSSGVLDSLAASLGIAIVVAILALSAAIPAARAIALSEFPGKQAVLFALLLPVLAPPIASAMGVHTLFIRYGLADTVAGVILVHLIPAAPYATLMLVASFSRLNPDLEAVARTLGASSWSVWRHVTFPAIAPGMAAGGALAFLVSWSQYLLTLLIGGGRVETLPLSMVAFQRSGDEAVAAALALVFIAPALIVFALVARFLNDNG